MALLLRGCVVAPAVSAAPAAFRRAELLPRRRTSSRLVAVASAARSTPSAPSGDGGAATVAPPPSDARGHNGVAGGTNGAVAPNPKATAIETAVERVIFDFRFLALLAVAGSLLGSLLCFLNLAQLNDSCHQLLAPLSTRFCLPIHRYIVHTVNARRTYSRITVMFRWTGCVFIKEAFQVYWSSCLRGVHSGQMVLKVVEAIDVYLAGTVMLIFGMGLYGLFISNASSDVPSESDRALRESSLFGMFALKERPKWMKITSLDELKTKVGHVIVMILLVKMFERSKTVSITTGLDLLSYAVCIFLSSASLYILHNLHKENHEDSALPQL
ncbi:hypothetical protein EJB05_10778, partial [Eragrostis curvula]